MKKELIGLALLTLLFGSCAKEQGQEALNTDTGTPLVLSVEAEVSVSDDELRALYTDPKHELSENSRGQLVPMPKLADGDKVAVHTMLKSTEGASAIVTVNWTYNAQAKKLVLKAGDAGNNFDVQNFHPSNTAQWFVSGFIGGVLNDKKVTFEGERLLGSARNAGEAIEGLKVPYSFGWAPVKINTESALDATKNSYQHGLVVLPNDVVFKPHGSLIAIKLGNDMNYDIKLEELTVSSDSYGDMVTFDMDTEVVAGARPTYTLEACAYVMHYALRDRNTERLTAGRMLDKTYYAWVIGVTENRPAEAHTRVTFNAEPVQPRAGDYTGKYLTSYERRSGASGHVAEGRVHPLTAKATTVVRMPLEYVTDYNVAGGDSQHGDYENTINRIPSDYRVRTNSAGKNEFVPYGPMAVGGYQTVMIAKSKTPGVPDITRQMDQLHFYVKEATEQVVTGSDYEPLFTASRLSATVTSHRYARLKAVEGSVGPLRFANKSADGGVNANPYGQLSSGYYNWYVCSGTTHDLYNPNGLNLATAINTQYGTDYRMPEQDDWWGVFPGDPLERSLNDDPSVGRAEEPVVLLWNRSQQVERVECMKVGAGTASPSALMQSYKSVYSGATNITSTEPGFEGRNEIVIYAMRFTKNDDCDIVVKDFYGQPSRHYYAAPDNNMKCAYRYRAITIPKNTTAPGGSNEAKHLIIESVYLGNASTEELSDISTPQWWETQKNNGKVVSRTLPTIGYLKTIEFVLRAKDTQGEPNKNTLLKYSEVNPLFRYDIYRTFPVLSPVLHAADYQSITRAKYPDSDVVANLNANYDLIGMRVAAPDALEDRFAVRLFKSNVMR